MSRKKLVVPIGEARTAKLDFVSSHHIFVQKTPMSSIGISTGTTGTTAPKAW